MICSHTCQPTACGSESHFQIVSLIASSASFWQRHLHGLCLYTGIGSPQDNSQLPLQGQQIEGGYCHDEGEARTAALALYRQHVTGSNPALEAVHTRHSDELCRGALSRYLKVFS